MAPSGMGGVGKTTMMEQLNEAAVDSKYYLGGECLIETTKDARVDRLRDKFNNMLQDHKKLLIIMDDLWKEVDLKDVGLASLYQMVSSCFSHHEMKLSALEWVLTLLVFKVGVLNDAEAKT
ncbi:probable disease resistance protein isoform X1, partial [Tanacetum coccineum]